MRQHSPNTHSRPTVDENEQSVRTYCAINPELRFCLGRQNTRKMRICATNRAIQTQTKTVRRNSRQADRRACLLRERTQEDAGGGMATATTKPNRPFLLGRLMGKCNVLDCLRDNHQPRRKGAGMVGKGYYLRFFGARTMISCRPSIFGYCSTEATSSRSTSIRFIISIPSSWCAISRPR